MKRSALFLLVVFSCLGLWAQNQNAAWVGQNTPVATKKGSRVSRGYIIPRVRATPQGAELTVEIYQDRYGSEVTLVLQAAINTGSVTRVVPIKILSDKVNDNKKSYYSERKFSLTYSELNRALKNLAPNASNLKIGPGTPLFVYALFETGHQWGGPERGGVFFMPTDGTKTVTTKSSPSKQKITELDLAFPINSTITNIFNIADPKVGLQDGGQIRSRVEGEGKYQILSESEFNASLKKLLDLAADPAKAANVIGSEWTLKLEDRYLKKTAAGNVAMDKNGLPIPDPMIDTYYDNKDYEAAKNDMAIRYRWTGGNQTGAWNFKPGMGQADSEGVVYRTEFAVDTTDNKPSSIEHYADSLHPLNIFKSIRQVIPGSIPSTFFEPSVEISDSRYKFKLQHTNGLAIEISLDKATAKSLRSGGLKPIRFYQMEMDIDHLATQSQNVAGNSLSNDYTSLTPEARRFLKGLGSRASFEGLPEMHSSKDVLANSSLRQSREAEFDLAQKVIVKIRNATIGKRWFPGSQKYAVAAHALGLLGKGDSSASVNKLLSEINKARQKQPALSCPVYFGGQ